MPRIASPPVTEADPFQVAYLPWADLPSEVRIGPVRFVPLKTWLAECLPDVAHRRFWNRYARCHVDAYSKPLSTLACVVVDGEPFGVLRPEVQVWIQRACDALVAAYFFAGYASRALPENRRPGGTPIAYPDRFQLVIKSYRPADQHATITAGNLSSMWKLRNLRIQRPHHISGGWCVEPDASLFAGLGKLIQRKPTNPEVNGLWSALSWLRYAFSGGDAVTLEARVVMMTTAFEHLLAPEKSEVLKRAALGKAVPQGQAKPPRKKPKPRGGEVSKAWGSLVREWLVHADLLKVRHRFSQKKRHVVYLPHQWFLRFFDLRSAIVHGGQLKSHSGAYRGHPHLLLAGLFLWMGVRAKLTERRLFLSSPNDPLRLALKLLTGAKGSKAGALKRDLKQECQQLYKALGWLKKR